MKISTIQNLIFCQSNKKVMVLYHGELFFQTYDRSYILVIPSVQDIIKYGHDDLSPLRLLQIGKTHQLLNIATYASFLFFVDNTCQYNQFKIMPAIAFLSHRYHNIITIFWFISSLNCYTQLETIQVAIVHSCSPGLLDHYQQGFYAIDQSWP